MARRVNTRFLIILTAAVGVLIVGALVTYKLRLFRESDPQKYIASAEKLMAEKNYDEALRNYQQAISVQPRNPALWVTFGDAFARLAAIDSENGGRARAAYEKALEIDPTHKEALSRLLEIWQAQADLAGQRNIASVAEQGRTIADRLAKVDPGNAEAAAAGPIFTIRAWMSGVETDSQKIDAAIATLKDIAAKHPADDQPPYYVALALLNRAQQQARGGQAAAAHALSAEALQTMEAAGKQQPDNALIQVRTAQIRLTALPLVGPSTQPSAATQPANPREEQVTLAKANIDRAAELSRPEDESYVTVQLAIAKFAQQTNDRPRAEKIYRQVLEHQPDEQQARLELANLLNPAHRAEAIALLEHPVNNDGYTGAKALYGRSLEIQTILTLTNMRLDQYAATPASDKQERDKLLAQINEGNAKVGVAIGEDNPLYLKLRGKLQRLQPGQGVEAIQTLNRAMTLMEQQGSTADPNYYEVLDLLARSYTDSNQTGQAKILLDRLLDRVPGYIPGHLLLAQILLREGDVAAAKPHVDLLERVLPNSPEVIKLHLATLNPAAQQEQVQETYARLPEKSRSERLEKASAALAIGNRAEATRLLKAILAENPGDVDAAVNLARLYSAGSDEEKAEAAVVVDAAMKANPDNATLQLMQKQLANASPEELRKFRRELASKTTDPLAREMLLFDLARDDGKADEAFQHLKAAEKIKPDDRRVMEELFKYHAGKRQWDDATRYVDGLARINADQAGGNLYRFQLAMARGDVPGAMNFARELTSKLPEFAQSWLSLAQAQKASGQYDEAIQNYQRALEKQNENADALAGIIECYETMGRTDDAKRYIDQAVKSLPNNPVFAEALTKYELTYGDVDKGVQAREQGLKQQPDNAQAWLAAGRAYLQAAGRKTSRKQDSAARDYLAKAFDTIQKGVAKFPDEPVFYNLLTQASLQMKKPEAAESALKALAERDAWKGKSEPAMLLADFYARAGRLADSEKVLRDLIARQPADVNAQLALVELLARQNKAEEAIKALDAGNTSDERIVRRRIELTIASGQLDDADQRLQKAIAANPKSVDLLALSGYVNLGRQKWDEAANRLQQALDIDPRNATAQYYLALVRLQQPVPDLDEGIRLLTSVREQNPNNVEARFALGRAYLRRNDLDNAIHELEAALQLQPTNKIVRLTLSGAYASAAPPRWSDVERTLREGRELAGASNDPDLLREEAMMWLKRKDSAKAVQSIRQAMAAAPQAASLVQDYLNILLDTHDYASVIREADQRLAGEKASDPSLWWIYRARGVARRYSNDKDGAMKDLETALTLAGAQNNEAASTEVVRTIASEIGVDEALSRVLARAETAPRWYLAAAYLYQAKNDLTAAVSVAEKANTFNSQLNKQEQQALLRALAGLYQARAGQGDLERAKQAYLKFLDAQPTDLAALNNLACLYADEGDLVNALKYSQSAYNLMIKEGRKEPLLLDTHGWILVLNNRLDEGIELLRQALAAKPFLEGHYHLAEAYLRRSIPEEAQKQLDLADQSIQQADAQKVQVDPALRAKVEAAKIKVKQQIQQKTEAKLPSR